MLSILFLISRKEDMSDNSHAYKLKYKEHDMFSYLWKGHDKTYFVIKKSFSFMQADIKKMFYYLSTNKFV